MNIRTCSSLALVAALAHGTVAAHNCPVGQHHSYRVSSQAYSAGGRGLVFTSCAVDDIKMTTAEVGACYKDAFTFRLPSTAGYKNNQHSAVQNSGPIWANSTNTHRRYIETLVKDNGGTISQSTAGYIYVAHACSTNFFYLEAPAPDEDLGSSCDSPQAGNPVSISNGNKVQIESDYSVATMPDGPVFSRTHNSHDAASSNLGKSWRHSFSRAVVPRFSSSPSSASQSTRTSAFYDAANACTKGWLQIRNGVRGLEQATAAYSSGVCTLSVGGAPARTISVLSTASAPASWDSPAVVGYYAIDDSGRREYFALSGGNLVASPGISSTLTMTSGGFTRSDLNGNVETYDADGLLMAVAGRGRPATTLTYDSNNRLQAIASAFGHTLTLGYDSQGRLLSLQDPLNQVTSYSYDSAGMLSKVTYPDSTERTYLYENTAFPSSLTGIIDENQSRFATWSYDSAGRVTSSSHAGGADHTSFVYNSNGSTTVTDALNATRTYFFQTVGGHKALSSMSGPACNQCGVAESITYDTNGNVTSRTDFNQNTTNFSYDAMRNLETSRTEAFGTPEERTITTAWHPAHKVPTVIAEPGRRTTHGYDSATGRRVSTTVEDLLSNEVRTETYSYDSSTGMVAAVDGPRTDVSDVTLYAYYQCTSGGKCGQIHTIENAMGHVTTVTDYDASGRPLSVTNPSGLVSEFTWNERGRLSSRSVAGNLTSFDYDDAGLISKVTGPTGAYFEYEYDSAHRLVGIEDELGNRVEYELDTLGNRIEERHHNSVGSIVKESSAVFNTANQLIETNGGNGQLIELDYDSQGNPIAETTAGTFSTTLDYDALNRVKSVTDAELGVTSYQYDPLDRPAGVTDPRGLVTRYTVNAFGDLLKLESPDSGTTTSTYDSAGNLTSRVDAKAQTTTYSYDALNRLREINHSGIPSITFTYDQGLYGKGRLTTMNDTSGTTSWVYNAEGLVESKTMVVGSSVINTSFTYDVHGRLLTRTLPSGNIVGTTWSTNKILTVTINGNPLANNLVREAFGPLNAWNFANGEVVLRTYDLSGRMVGHSLGSNVYDTSDRVVSINQGGLSLSTGITDYEYDAINRLVRYDDAVNSIVYSYDASGNRTQVVGGSGTQTITTDIASNRLLSVTSSSAAAVYSFDANGSVLSDGNNSYSYDSAGRLSTANSGSYTYNGFRQRARKSVAGSAVYFTYDENGRLAGEYDSSGNLIQETVWIENVPFAVLKPSGVFYIHSDHLNTPRQIDDQNGDAVWLWETVTFGDNAPNEDPLSTGTLFSYHLRHSGQYFDIESGLMQNWHRSFSAETGRYLESDPVGLAAGINTYAYADGNPISGVDPLGLWVEGTYDQRTGILNLMDMDTGASVTSRYFSGGSQGDPVPNGVYDILSQDGRDGFYRLEPVDAVYGDDRHDRTGRDKFRLHRPGGSRGCITAIDWTEWDPVKGLIDITSTDSVELPSKWINPVKKHLYPTEQLRRFGWITVTGSK